MDSNKSVAKWLTLVGLLCTAMTIACGSAKGQDLLPTPRATVTTGAAAGTTTTVAPTATIAGGPAVTTERVTYTRSDDRCVRLIPALGGGPGQDLLLDVASRQAVLRRLQGHSARLDYAAFSPDGQTVVTADPTEVRLWQSDTGRLLHSFRHEQPILSPSFSPDGAVLATAIGELMIRLWDATTGAAQRDFALSVQTQVEGDLAASSLQYSPDGRLIAATIGRAIVLVDAVTGEKVGELAGEVFHEDEGEQYIGSGHAGRVTALAFSPAGDVLISSGEEGTVWLWDLVTGEPLRCFDAQRYVEAIAMSPDGRTVVATIGSALLFWDAVDGRLRDRWQAPADPDTAAFAASGLGTWATTTFNAVHYRGDGASFVVSMQDQTARIYDATSGELQGLLRHPRPVNWAEFSPDGGQIITAIGSFYDTAADPIYEAWIWDATHPDLALAAAAQNLVEAGIGMALNGDMTGALDSFADAQALNPYPQADLVSEGRGRAALALVEQAAAAARAGSVQEAQVLVDAAQEISPAPQVDLRPAARTHIVNALNASVRERARNGDVEGAIATAATIALIDPGAQVSIAALDDLCRYGSLWDAASTVLPACDLAVELAPTEYSVAEFRDSRGIARALSGDYAGAVEDFEAYVAFYADWPGMGDEVARRQEWIATLRAGSNPIDEAEMETLRLEPGLQ